ncbi:MAG: NAD(P)-binding domain-containing protein [Thermoproteota archaeon]|nr:NAD(P)-binding domain-containing protein [Thermoproteota archaeon]
MSAQNKCKIMFEKVLVVGLGQLGLPVAKYVKEKGFDTYGYDINPQAMEFASENSGIKKIETFSDIDVFILCISTHKPDDIYSPHIDGLLTIAEKISKEAKDGSLVSIESTIAKGTSKKIFELLNHRLHVAHAPHRWYALEEDIHGVNQLRVIGGVSDCCLRLALGFYDGRNDNLNNTEGVSRVFENEEYKTNKSLEIPMHPVSEIEIAELTKVIENANRYMQIAFAEDLYLYCQANNIGFSELRNALNTKWNVNILEPRDGIGGHCLPKDTKMFIHSSRSIRSKILSAAMEVDSDYRVHRQSRCSPLLSVPVSKAEAN